jgi:flagellar biosynthesis chaperone FliJ
MRRRHLAKRLERIAGLKEQQARVARARAERRLRECEEEIVRLEQAQANAELEILQRSQIAGFSPLALIETSREATHLAVERQREMAIARREELDGEVVRHVKTLAERHSAEKVRERVVQRWRAESDRRERIELDDLAGVHHGRK